MTIHRRVLIVEDDDSIRDLVQMTLLDEGYDVVTASHGAAALDLIEGSRPDFILLDMCMPVMDGWEFSRLYHNTPGPHAPIVILTAGHEASVPAAEIGADGYLSKPFNLEDLISIVSQHTR